MPFFFLKLATSIHSVIYPTTCMRYRGRSESVLSRLVRRRQALLPEHDIANFPAAPSKTLLPSGLEIYPSVAFCSVSGSYVIQGDFTNPNITTDSTKNVCCPPYLDAVSWLADNSSYALCVPPIDAGTDSSATASSSSSATASARTVYFDNYCQILCVDPLATRRCARSRSGHGDDDNLLSLNVR